MTLEFQPVSPFSIPSLDLCSVSDRGKDQRRKHIFFNDLDFDSPIRWQKLTTVSLSFKYIYSLG